MGVSFNPFSFVPIFHISCIIYFLLRLPPSSLSLPWFSSQGKDMGKKTKTLNTLKNNFHENEPISFSPSSSPTTPTPPHLLRSPSNTSKNSQSSHPDLQGTEGWILEGETSVNTYTYIYGCAKGMGRVAPSLGATSHKKLKRKDRYTKKKTGTGKKL